MTNQQGDDMTTRTHFDRCPVSIRANEYRDYIRRSETTVAEMETDHFESDPVCDCADRRLQIRQDQFAIAAGRAIGRRGY